jgi:pimeloyl-ACP methyl ester carboxylesterase
MERGGPAVGAATRERRAPRWAGETARRFEQRVDGDRLAWLQAGSGPPLLLLHGYAGDAQWWRRNLRALARARTVYALDVPGFGASRLSGRYTFARSVNLLARWMDLHDLVPADIVGHSMGGQLAVLLAARHPERVRRLVLLAPAGLPFETGLLGIAVRAMRSRLGADVRFTPIVLRGVLRTGPRVLWQALAQIRETDIRPALASVRVPTLIVWGTRDRLLLSEGAATIAAAIAGAEVRTIPGGHNLFFDRAGAVNALIPSFLDQTAP